MNIWEVVVLSVVQGVTEWLPISSSGHLVLLESWFGVAQNSLSFDVFLHFGSLLVLLVYFRKQIIALFKKPAESQVEDRRIWILYIIISSIFTAGIGYFLYHRIDFFRTPDQVANWYFVTAALLLLTKFFSGNGKITWWKAIIIGIVQGVAVLPGLSRSGSVIAAALIMKVNRREAFEYGFLTAIPAIGGAFLLQLRDMSFSAVYFLGLALTMFIGYITLELLRKIVQNNNLYLFFTYTFILGLLIKFL